MSSAVSFLLVGLQVSVTQALVCPLPFLKIRGVCLHFPTGKGGTTWCEAQAYCSSVGGELVKGDQYLPLAGIRFNGMPKDYWIGLTDMLHERRNKRGGWRWTDGSVAKPHTDLIWNGDTEPGNENKLGSGDCVRQCLGSGNLCDVGCSRTEIPIVPMCQQRQPPS